MKEQEAISYLDNLEIGNYVTVNIPLLKDENIPVTAMYLGKDDKGRYNFADTGKFVFTKEFIERGKITLDKEYDGDKAYEIYTNLQKDIQKQKKNKSRER